MAKMQRLMQLLRTGGAGSKPVKTNLVVIATDAVNSCASGRPAPDFECEQEEVWLTMEGDRMTSVMENLIQNAQDATADDGTVTVSLDCKGNNVEIIIEDNGCGMDAAFVRERLFQPFYTTKGDTGMGIGAYECKEYINSLGGEIQIESEPGSGTRMHVMLPLQVREQSVNSDYKHMESVG